MPKSGPRELALYFQHRLREAVKGGREARELAGEAGVSAGQISQLMNHAKGYGFQTHHGMLAVFGLTEEKARVEAEKFVREHPEVLTGERAETRLERDARYPNLEAAIPFFLAKRGSRAAAELVRGIALKSESDLSPDEWLAELQVADRRLKAEQRFPVETERREAEREVQGAKLDAEVRERVARGETAEPGWKVKLEAAKRKKSEERARKTRK